MRISDWSSDVCSSDLALGLVGGFLRGEHIVRMDDLQFLPILFEPSRHAACLAQGQQLLHPARAAAEIDEAHVIARYIGRMAARGPAPRALAVIDRGQRDRDRAARSEEHKSALQ